MSTKRPQSLYIPAPRLNQFRILQQIAANPHITQAELARRCSISVAMVNNYMQDLCSSGFLEYQRKSSKTISYHLTPNGREAASATMQQLILELVGLFAAAKEHLRDIVRRSAGSEIHRVVLYGSGDLAELVFHALDDSTISVVGVCDDDAAKIGREWCGRELLNPSQIKFIAPDAVIVTDSDSAEAMHKRLMFLLERGIRLISLSGFSASLPNQWTQMCTIGQEVPFGMAKEGGG